MGKVTIREAREQDAAVIAALCNRLSAHEGQAEDIFTAAHILRDAFGPNPAFEVLLAELDGETVGYAMFEDFYNSDLAARGVWLHDLFVEEAARGKGAGRALMAATAQAALKRGARTLWWGVLSSNVKARAFYAGLGARDDDARILELADDALQDLARSID